MADPIFVLLCPASGIGLLSQDTFLLGERIACNIHCPFTCVSLKDCIGYRPQPKPNRRLSEAVEVFVCFAYGAAERALDPARYVYPTLTAISRLRDYRFCLLLGHRKLQLSQMPKPAKRKYPGPKLQAMHPE